MNKFLSIPPFKSMILLHGFLIWGGIWLLASYFMPMLLIKPEHADEIHKVQLALYICFFFITPIFSIYHYLMFRPR